MEARRKRSYASCTPRETIRQEESCQLEVVAEAGAGVDWGDGRDMALGRIPRTAEIEKTGEIQLPTELIAGERRGLLVQIGVVWSATADSLWIWEISAAQKPFRLQIQGKIDSVHLAHKPEWLFPASVTHIVLISIGNTTQIYGFKPPLQLLSGNIVISTPIFPIFCSLSSGRLFVNGQDGSISEAIYGKFSWFSQTKRLKLVEIEGRSWTQTLACSLKLRNRAVVRAILGEESRKQLYVWVETGPNNFKLDIYSIEGEIKRLFSITRERLAQKVALSTPSMLESMQFAPIQLYSLPIPWIQALFWLTSSGHQISITFPSLFSYEVAVELLEVQEKDCKWLQNCTLVEESAARGATVAADWAYQLPKELGELLGVRGRNPCEKPRPSYILAQTSTVNYVYLPAACVYQLAPVSVLVFTEKRPMDGLKRVLEGTDGSGVESFYGKHGKGLVRSWLFALLLSCPKPSFSGLPDEKTLNLHLSRVLRPIWREKVVQADLIPAFRPCHLAFILEKLERVVKFVEKHCQDRLVPFRADGKGVRSDYQHDGLYQAHRLALRSMQVLTLFESIETQSSLRKTFEVLDSQQKATLADMRFRELLSSSQGQKLCSALVEIHALHSKSAGDFATHLETLSARFPCLFPQAAVCAAQARELLRLGNAVEAAKRVLPFADLDLVPVILTVLREKGEVRDCAQLCLARISALGPQNESLTECITLLIDTLQTAKPQTRDLIDYISALSLNIDVKALHFALFRWILDSPYPHLLEIQHSKHLFPFLNAHFTPQDCQSFNAKALLHRGSYLFAYEEFLRVAKLTEIKETRKEMLNFALLCVDNAMKTARKEEKTALQAGKKEVLKLIQEIS